MRLIKTLFIDRLKNYTDRRGYFLVLPLFWFGAFVVLFLASLASLSAGIELSIIDYLEKIKTTTLIGVATIVIFFFIPISKILSEQSRELELAIDKNVIFHRILNIPSHLKTLLFTLGVILLWDVVTPELKFFLFPFFGAALLNFGVLLIEAYAWFGKNRYINASESYRNKQRVSYLESLSENDQIDCWKLIVDNGLFNEKQATREMTWYFFRDNFNQITNKDVIQSIVQHLNNRINTKQNQVDPHQNELFYSSLLRFTAELILRRRSQIEPEEQTSILDIEIDELLGSTCLICFKTKNNPYLVFHYINQIILESKTKNYPTSDKKIKERLSRVTIGAFFEHIETVDQSTANQTTDYVLMHLPKGWQIDPTNINNNPIAKNWLSYYIKYVNSFYQNKNANKTESGFSIYNIINHIIQQEIEPKLWANLIELQYGTNREENSDINQFIKQHRIIDARNNISLLRSIEFIITPNQVEGVRSYEGVGVTTTTARDEIDKQRTKNVQLLHKNTRIFYNFKNKNKINQIIKVLKGIKCEDESAEYRLKKLIKALVIINECNNDH